jgi:hypothetical protein
MEWVLLECTSQSTSKCNALCSLTSIFKASLMEGITQSCFPTKLKSNSYEAVQGFGGGQIMDFFIPRFKSSRFDPLSQLLSLGGQYCILLLQWILFSSLRDFKLSYETRISAHHEGFWCECERQHSQGAIQLICHPHQ